MRHPYNPECECKHCTKEGQRRLFQHGTRDNRFTRGRRARTGERVASREVQHARYLDCGPQAWDDRESPSGDY